ncbi:MAG: hypothetical protein Q8P44_04225 [Dehalococcoidia bacterium]|nr:hypothetical protein [Dehalococcoidia bacterium]
MQKGGKKEKPEVKECLCPYCEEETIDADLPFCQACKALMSYCYNCEIVAEKGLQTCPRCGEPLGKKQ